MSDDPQSAAPRTIEEIAAAEVAAMTPTPAPKGVDESQILAKVMAGLTRDQAIDVLQQQSAHEAALAKAAKKNREQRG